MNVRKIGFSHGSTHKILEPSSEENINLFKDCGCNAIEVNCHSISRIETLDDILHLVKNFEYRSIHLPCDLKI